MPERRWKSQDAVGRIDDPNWDSAQPSLSPATRRTLIVLSLPLAAIVLGLGLTVRSRMVFGTWSFWSTPERINYCGRRYYPSPDAVTGAHANLLAEVSGNPTWRTIGHTFVFRPIEGPIPRHHPDTNVCAMTLYVPIGHNRYRSYGLSGGP